MPSLPVAITGLGLCTPLGDTVDSTWQALLAGEAIADHCRAAGGHPHPRVISLAEHVARQAVRDAKWNQRQIEEAALVVGTSKGPIESWLESPPDAGPPCLFGLSEIASRVAVSLGLGHGPRLTLSTACASGLHALIRAAMLIGEGCPRAIVVAAESSLHPLFVGSFKRLGVLAPGGFGCRPFDADRAGFIVSEAAAAVCLEPSHDGQGVRIERFALGGDATHLTGGDPSGRTLRKLLANVVDHRPVDLIHAHGTGTVANDPVELAAIESVCDGSVRPALYSHKGALGHSLGAAGLISVVVNCLCHERGMIPPNVKTTHPLEMRGVYLFGGITRRVIRRSLAIASGFGGAAAAVSLVK